MSKFSDEEQAELTQIQEYHANKQKIKLLEQQLQQAHRDATKEVAKAHKRGWEQAKAEAVKEVKPEVYPNNKYIVNTIFQCADAIAAMEYGGKAND